MRQHTICGASIIELVPGDPTKPPDIYARPVISANNQSDDQAGHPLASAIVRFLSKHVESDLAWQVDLVASDLSRAAGQDAVVARSEHPPQRGTIRPWLGRQKFVVRWSARGRRQEAVVAAEIKLPPTIVVAARDLPRGAVLEPGDLKTKAIGQADRTTQSRSPSEHFEFSEDVVGKQATRLIRAGQVVEAEGVESVELVRRGERVAIVVNHNGVRVRTEGRARDSGGKGDTVLVESAARRSTFQATVSGVNEVELDVGRGALGDGQRRQQWR
jgi:flagella basal body P-ring formation protein FlgA